MRFLFLVLLFLVAGPVVAQEVPQSRQQITLSFAPVARQVAPAVVNIFADRIVNERVSPFANDPLFSMLFGEGYDLGIPRQRMDQALGSGVIVRADGLIVTNRHVIEEAQEIWIILNDRREFPAEIVTVDDKTDLAVLRAGTGGASLPVLALGDSDALEVGDLVLAIGNPFGVGQTVTSGIVSATARMADGINDYGYFIQTDAAINPGNSGGALVNMAGELIGINTAIYSQSGGSLGIGFAIPANLVKTVIQAGESGHRLVRPWLGAGVQAVTAEMASSLGMERPVGVIIKSIRTGSPLADAGLKTGDILLSVNSQRVDTPEALRFRMGTLAVGGEAQLSYLRRGELTVASFKLMAPPETPPRQETALKNAGPFNGAKVVNLSPAVIEETGYDGAVDKGVMILQVTRRSPAAFVGLEPGDIVLEVNRQPIAAVADLVETLQTRARQWRVKIRRGDQVITSVLR